MSMTISNQKALEIISKCEEIESFTAYVKAEMKAVLEGVGTHQDMPKKKNTGKKARKIEDIKARFYR